LGENIFARILEERRDAEEEKKRPANVGKGREDDGIQTIFGERNMATRPRIKGTKSKETLSPYQGRKRGGAIFTVVTLPIVLFETMRRALTPPLKEKGHYIRAKKKWGHLAGKKGKECAHPRISHWHLISENVRQKTGTLESDKKKKKKIAEG